MPKRCLDMTDEAWRTVKREFVAGMEAEAA